MATKNMPHHDIVGAFETIEFPEFESGPLSAKIDTGAYTGALHCRDIEEKVVDGGEILLFTPFDTGKQVQKDDFLIKYVKSSNGKREKRYFITTTIILHGKEYSITLSLADRTEMKMPVLIGRRFLRHYGFLVDPRKNNGYAERG